MAYKSIVSNKVLAELVMALVKDKAAVAEMLRVPEHFRIGVPASGPVCFQVHVPDDESVPKEGCTNVLFELKSGRKVYVPVEYWRNRLKR